MQTYARLPVAFVRGEGTRLWDSEGKEYLDFLTGLATVSLGHAHPAVADAIADQARTLLHVSNLYLNDVQPRVAERLDLLLTSATGTPGRVFFANSGAEANECAIKLARRHGQANGGPGALPRALRVQLVPRPHAHDARGHRAAAEAGDVPAAADRFPPGRVRRRRRAGGRDGRARVARSCSSRSRGRAGSSRPRPDTWKRCGRCATSARPCCSSTRCRPGSDAPDDGSGSSTAATCGPTW